MQNRNHVCVSPSPQLSGVHPYSATESGAGAPEHLGSPWLQERYIQLAGTFACQSSQCCRWVWGGTPGWPPAIPAAQAGCQGQAELLTRSQGRAVGATLPHTTASLPPSGLGGAQRCWPLLAPCTSTWCPLASHGPGGAGPFAMGLARGDRAACHHHSI